MSLCVRCVRGSSLPDHSAVLEQVPRDAASTQWSTCRSVVLDHCPSWQCVTISGQQWGPRVLSLTSGMTRTKNGGLDLEEFFPQSWPWCLVLYLSQTPVMSSYIVSLRYGNCVSLNFEVSESVVLFYCFENRWLKKRSPFHLLYILCRCMCMVTGLDLDLEDYSLALYHALPVSCTLASGIAWNIKLRY